ncbi:hypothetical protein KP509_32G060000 [Ceratopteris richardii]|uniref:3-ketoacyl-CoA synthase n=1 Tax=Ceratopteris richardii TaxID=49495 RepID=A0A8T2QVA4_CERRI|nr:hypothetical protein KP509_32G060000 [Ceratopteris richardii]
MKAARELLQPSMQTLLSTLVGFFCLLLSLDVISLKTAFKHWLASHDLSISLVMACIVCLVFLFRLETPATIYVVDVACFRPPDSWRAPHATFLEHSKISGIFDADSLDFQRKILERSGLGETTSFPRCFYQIPPSRDMAAAREEAVTVLTSCMQRLLDVTGISPKDIDILIVNCSTFNPSPCLSSVLVNKFKLRSNTLTYNLGGMGCSAGVVALDLAKFTLKVHRNAHAVVVSTENITQNWYWGNDKTMLVSNCLFRVGGAAILLSNKATDRRRAKYRLDHIVRTHHGADDAAYHCAFQQEDEMGEQGVFLSKELMRIAADVLRINTKKLGALVLPYDEQLRFLGNYLLRAAFKAQIKAYIPDFKKAIKHFCIHSGGRAVISAVEKGLTLSQEDVEPSRATLHRFGNTSVSTIWYELQYLECKGRVKKGDKVWQIAFGSGFKCNSAVYTALRHIRPCEPLNAWTDTILEYPDVLYAAANI